MVSFSNFLVQKLLSPVSSPCLPNGRGNLRKYPKLLIWAQNLPDIGSLPGSPPVPTSAVSDHVFHSICCLLPETMFPDERK